MAEKQLLVVADADAFIALFQPADSNHQKAKIIITKLLKEHALIVMPITAMSEAITVFQRKLSNPGLADTLTKKLSSEDISILSVEEDIRELAMTLFNPYASKQNTFFDAIVAATAKVLNANAIFSFDRWYEKQGFRTVEELFEKEL